MYRLYPLVSRGKISLFSKVITRIHRTTEWASNLSLSLNKCLLAGPFLVISFSNIIYLCVQIHYFSNSFMSHILKQAQTLPHINGHLRHKSRHEKKFDIFKTQMWDVENKKWSNKFYKTNVLNISKLCLFPPIWTLLWNMLPILKLGLQTLRHLESTVSQRITLRLILHIFLCSILP